MPHFLLSWHGTILCHDSTRIFPASLDDADAGRATPILIDTGSSLVPELSSHSIHPDIAPDFPGAVALRSGETYLTVTSEGNVGESETRDQQALFLPLSKDILPLLNVLTSRDWADGNGHVVRGQLKELSLFLGETRLDPRGFENGPEGTILHHVSGTVLHSWPNENVERALAAVRSASETGEPGKHAIWAQWSELEGQIALVHAHRDHPPHLYYLARLCTLLGLFNEANLCLDALRGAINEIDLLVARSIVASCAEDDIVSALLLSQAFKKATLTRLETAEIEDYATRIRMGEFTHKRVLNDMRFRYQIALDAAFETALMPYSFLRILNMEYACIIIRNSNTPGAAVPDQARRLYRTRRASEWCLPRLAPRQGT
ncbi:hypothetical protein [Asaia prunellae]|uniref:hypothetical protein n=1 Tax=Asaia prunellae TaxID=610245 RepID=UPI00046F197F|nr:hypothetical protein [Asaia prunellae]